MPKKETGPAPKRKKGIYKLPEPIPRGFKVQDNQKKEWEIGESIGSGGFAEVYSATESNKDLPSKRSSKYPFAVKVEPKENGPLYCEIHFYMRAGKAEFIDEWKKTKKLKHFGISPFLGSGHFTYKNQAYRFLVTEKFGKSLYDKFEENNKHIPSETVLQMAIQLIDLLEYIHSKGYIHGDIKAANLLFGLKPGTEHYLHIVDYGMAKKFKSDVEVLPNDPRLACNGTIEYISRDGHNGVFGTRSDLEMLAFNLLHWFNSTLPWEKDIANSSIVQQKKEELMSSPSSYIKKNLPKVPAVMVKFLEYNNSLKNNQAIDFALCRKLFAVELGKLSLKPYEVLNFQVDEDTPDDNKPKKGVVSKKKPKTDEKVAVNGEGRRTRNSKAASASEVVENEPANDNVSHAKSEADKENTKKKRTTKKETTPGISWKNAPTIVASNVVKAGEYIKKAGPPKKRK